MSACLTTYLSMIISLFILYKNVFMIVLFNLFVLIFFKLLKVHIKLILIVDRQYFKLRNMYCVLRLTEFINYDICGHFLYNLSIDCEVLSLFLHCIY